MRLPNHSTMVGEWEILCRTYVITLVELRVVLGWGWERMKNS